MPSPFPGLNPYLEDPLFWEDVHTNLATEIRAQLQPRLLPRYVAVLTPYVTYEDVAIAESGQYKPDVAVLERDVSVAAAATTAAIPAPFIGVDTVAANEVPAKAQRIEIRAVGTETLVTVIEILSPSNKRPGTETYDAYVRKRRDLLRSPVHLLEIDLLRRGQRWPLEEAPPDAPGFVFLSRADHRPNVEIWPLTWEKALPPIPVPLRTPDPDVTFDLAEAFARVYELGAYDYRIDYRNDPPAPALAPAERTWLDEQLRASGRR
ncbi:MAG: DUF4058 family protein [Chloroflexaceae bacterium]|jgi:hypothetical protein|nr:DUF4058 family protein [Chloroflexaceae bacterium]